MRDVLKQNRELVLATSLAAVVGCFLRAWHLADQILIDDEWHGFYYALGKSSGWLLTHFSIPGATCIPLNWYVWLLGHCGGWSEIRLRLPSELCGLALVALCPLLAARSIGPRPAIALAWLLALSPVLIFYSRLCRPYSAVALLGFSCLLAAARWQQTGRVSAALLFAFSGVLAVYFHLFAVITVGAPLLTTLAFLLLKRFANIHGLPTGAPSVGQWWRWSAIMAIVGAILVLPAFVHSLQSTFFTIALKGSFDLHALPRVLRLLSGTSSPAVLAMLGLATLAGALRIWQQDRWWGSTLLSLYPLHVLALLLTRPDCAQSAIVLVRYCIPLVPVTLLLMACGLQAALELASRRLGLRPALQTLVLVAGLAALASAGPLPQTYLAPNNFTSHGAYQHNYGPIDWQRSFDSDLKPPGATLVTTIRVGEISPFYDTLAAATNGRPVVEYPMLIGDHFNPLYYYQHFHHRPVLVGYTTDVDVSRGLAEGNIFGNTYVDQVLSCVARPELLHFRNLVSLDDLPAMRRRGAEYILLHKRYEAELSQVMLPRPALARLYQQYEKLLGPPVWDDANLAVFRL